MEPFSAETLTILALISVIWACLTFIAVLVILIVFLCKFCAQGRRLKFINPARATSIVSLERRSPTITPVSIRPLDQHKQATRQYDAHSVLEDFSYSSHKNRYQQQDYMRDENDETTAKRGGRVFVQRRQYQSVKPLADLRVSDRHTPYPADVLARERLMNNTLFPAENKY